MKFIVLFAISIALGSNIVAQPTFTQRHYATQLRLKQLMLHPGVADSMASVERFTAQHRLSGSHDTVTVALIFHFLPLPPGAQQPSAEDVQAQLDRLNSDFFTSAHPYLGSGFQNPEVVYGPQGQVIGIVNGNAPFLHPTDSVEGFAERAGVPAVRFCLPTFDPDGQPATGLVYPAVPARTWGMSDSLFRIPTGGSTPWRPQAYCNVWVAALERGVAGFAQMPGGPAVSDGIVIDYRYFAHNIPGGGAANGHPYLLGRTLTHLMGSYLNLYELWSELTPCGDDYVYDTPIHNAPNDDRGDYRYSHISTCDGNPVEMVCNLMDNAPDAVQYMFTKGQVQRMRATLAVDGPRSQLRNTPTGCSNVAPLTDAFSEDRSDNQSPVVSAALNIRVFPNPASERFVLEVLSEAPASSATVRVFNSLGAEVYRTETHLMPGVPAQCTIESGHWGAGVYTVSVQQGEKKAVRLVTVGRN